MKIFVALLCLVSSSAFAKRCYKNPVHTFCVGDRVINHTAKSREELFGTLKNFSRLGDATVKWDDGKKRNVSEAYFKGNLDCIQLYHHKICIGDTIQVRRYAFIENDEGYTRRTDKVVPVKVTDIFDIHREQLDEPSSNDKKYFRFAGIDDEGNFSVEWRLIFNEGTLPQFPDLNFGETIPGTSHRLVEFETNQRSPYKYIDGKNGKLEDGDRENIDILLGKKSISLEVEESYDSHYGHIAKRQDELHKLYEDRLRDRCDYLVNPRYTNNPEPKKKVKLEDFKLTMFSLSEDSRLMIGAECLPLPIPWIQKDTTLSYRMTGTCKIID